MDQIHFHVKLTAKDLWKFSMYHAYKGFMGFFNALFTVVAIGALIIGWDSITTLYRTLLLVCALMFTVWQPLLLYQKSKKQAKSPVVQEPMDLVFEEDGFSVTQAGKKLDLTWDQVGRVESMPAMIIFYMDRVHAYLLPNSVLGEQDGAFRELLRQKLPKQKLRRI